MKTLPLVRLGTLKNGMNYDKTSAIQGCKIIGVSNFENNVFPDYSSLAEIDSSIVTESDLLHNGDIVFVRSNGNKKLVGRSMFITNVTEPICYSGFCISLHPNRDEILPEYLFYALRSPYCKKQYSYSQQTNITNLSQVVLGSVKVPIVPLKKQRDLSSILFNIDKKIALNKHINAELEAMAKTLYDYWFVQFDFPDENGKPYRTSGGAMEYNDQLKRKIPKGWKVGNLYAIADYINGLACQNFRPANNEAALPVVKIREMHEGISLDTECVSANIPKNKQINDGDILFSWSATLEVMYWIGGCAGLNQHIFKVVPKAAYPKEYVFHQLSEYVVNFVKMAEARKTTMGHITSDHIEQSRIVLPHKRILECFSTTASPIHQQIVNGMIENLELTRLRDWLLPMLMNGQATVADEQPMETPQNVVEMPGNDKRFDLWLQNQGIAARGDLDKKTLREIFDAMDDDDK